jgi:arylformamidase
MALYDLSLAIHAGMLVYPGDSPPAITRTSSIDQGAALTTSVLTLPAHAGTHVDAPAHFLAGGRTLSDYPPDAFFGPGVVVDLARHAHVSAAALAEHELPVGRHLLLRTRNSARLSSAGYDRDHACVEPAAAEVLIALRPLSIGFDYYSVDPSTGLELVVHRRLAQEGLLAYVCLDLSAVPAGECTFFGLPLRLDGVEASPVRALALRGD